MVIFHDRSLVLVIIPSTHTVNIRFQYLVSLGLPWALEEHTHCYKTQWRSHVHTTVSMISLRYALARCKEKKRNHSKSAHISQRSFLYGESFLTKHNNIHNRRDTERRKKQQIRGGKNEKRHNIRWMKGWWDYHTQWKVWQLKPENVKCLRYALTSEVNCHFK